MSRDDSRYISAAGAAVLIWMLVIAITPQPANAQFVIASWEYPDEYAQGIILIGIEENSSGSWVSIGPYYDHDDSYILNWTVGVAMRLECWTLLNSTLAGIASLAQGLPIQRHNVIVTDRDGDTVFSQQNFTYVDSYDIDDPLYTYVYRVVLNFLPQHGEYYTVTVNYEIYYPVV